MIAYCTLPDIGHQDLNNNADWLDAINPLLAATQHIHAHCGWTVLLSPRKRWQLYVLDSTTPRTLLGSGLPAYPVAGTYDREGDALFSTSEYMRERDTVTLTDVLVGFGTRQDTGLTIAQSAGHGLWETTAGSPRIPLHSGSMVLMDGTILGIVTSVTVSANLQTARIWPVTDDNSVTGE